MKAETRIRRSLALGALAAATLAMVAGVARVPAAQARAGAIGGPSSPPVKVWITFVNPDGSTVLVAHNENDNPQSFSVSENGQSFDYDLPGDSLATFVWASPPGPPPPVRLAGGSGARRAGQPMLQR